METILYKTNIWTIEIWVNKKNIDYLKTNIEWLIPEIIDAHQKWLNRSQIDNLNLTFKIISKWV